MLDSMRRGVTNIFTKFLLALLIVAFAVWGIGDVVRRSTQGALAKVGSTEITTDEYRQAYQDELQSVSRRLGHRITPAQAKLLGLETRTLARLIGFAAIDIHARKLGLTVAENIVANVIRADPAFAGPTGQFSKSQFNQAIRQSGYQSESQYIQARHRDILREQLTETLGAGAGPPPSYLKLLYHFNEETRTLEYMVPDYDKHIKIADPDDSALREFYDQKKRQYIALEQRKANLLLLTRDESLLRISVSDDETKATYEATKGTYNIPEKRRIAQLTFADKAAADKAYAELSKAKNFEEAATKLGFPAADVDLGLLTRAEMIDSKIADAAFALKKNELSPPVQGQFSVALLRVSEIQPGKQRTFDEVKGEIRDRIGGERIVQKLQELHDAVEAERAKGKPLKDIAEQLKLPFREIAEIDRLGRTADGKAAVGHSEAGRIAEAIFEASPGVETEAVELADGGYAWFDVVSTTPERQKPFEEVKAEVRVHYIEAERRREMAAFAQKQAERITAGEGIDKVAKELGIKVMRTEPLKRSAAPPGLPASAVKQAFALAKGTATSVPSPDEKSRVILRVADITRAPDPTPAQTEALKAELAKQVRIDLLEQYVSGLRTRYGVSVNETLLKEALGPQTEQLRDTSDD
ncbi:MAG: SurA N-terminal domain-containing protein [Hyphomonadaceae bacterium]|jgi:peptidyl-prolyl cis-trans isomerase D|nr:SurA N-terminal domain-containing protein [Hyphomonadaceae bacterium]